MTAHPIVVGTAGHIDHGKTALVRALTGIDTDRLPVEKKRGITTELGFAHLALGGDRIAVIDVPGHERFVRAMVAGAGGLDLAMLVVAADEGVMPQTREHLDICGLLGVRGGVVVLTKRDLVDDEWLAMIADEVRAFVAGTFLAGAPVVAVSARTGEGLDELRAALAAAVAAVPPRDPGGVFRLPVDRVFTIKGFGTVVTGTVWGGRVRATDELIVLPRGLATRARGLELHGEPATEAIAGQRAALNLAGVGVDDLARGDVVAHPGEVAPSHILDVRFRHLAAATAPLPPRARVLLHHGTAQVMAVLQLDAPLPPGQTAVGQLRLDATTPLPALPGDRFIARGFVPLADHGTTIGGGEIVRALAAKRRRGAGGDAVAALGDATLAARLAFELRAAAAAGATAATLGPRVGRPAGALAAPLGALVEAGDAVVAGNGAAAVFLHAAAVAELERRALDTLDAAPDQAIGREELRGKLPAALPVRAFDVVLEGLVRRGAAVRDGEQVRRGRRAAAPALAPLDQEVLERFRAWGVEPARPKEVPAALGRADAEVRAALDRLLAARLLTKIKPDLFVATEIVDALRGRLRAHLDAHGQVTPQEWKELTGASRKYSIPLAEHFDAEKVTLRVGDVRKRRG